MAVNALGSTDVPLSLFSSLDTELSASDLPEGISPDNQDVVFTPGAVATRPALQKIFPDILDSGFVMYEKSFVLPNGNVKNLYLSSSGTMWVEDVTNSPGTATNLFTTTATTACSVTEDGREWIALSDGVHGADVPVSYDGTNVYRVTYDGPGTPPKVANFIIPPIALFLTSAVTTSITSITPTDFTLGGFFHNYFATFTVVLTAPATVFEGEQVTIAGNSNTLFNGIWTVLTVISSTTYKVSLISPMGTLAGTGGTSTTPAFTLIRSGNMVTASLVTNASLQVGFLIQITGVSATAVGGGITSIVIDNESLPGIATVTTATPHGLLPLNNVTLLGIPSTIAGTAITAALRNGDIATITTSSEHGLAIGSSVTIAGVSDVTFDGSWIVASIVDEFNFTYVDVDANSTSSGGTVALNWPVPNTATPTYFQVISAPSTTTFQVALNYADATFGSGGTVSFAWDGQFYISGITPLGYIQYQQYGPDALSTDVGLLTPVGQVTPGVHQLQVMGITATGAITEPSPPVSFIANGGQYLSISDLVIGPASWVGRILQFTGSGGAFYFYIPVPAQVNGQIVSTATQINDNTTTGITLDFSDNTLFASLATSVPGNNLVEQIVLGPCAGFFAYSSRLQAWGDYNKVENLLNMGFDGGFLPSAPTLPTGWVSTGSGGALTAGRFAGFAWAITAGGPLQQSFYQDAYGDPIALGNTNYSAKAYFSGAGSVAFSISSVSTSFSSTVVLTATGAGWKMGAFSMKMPTNIPSDMLLSFVGTGTFSLDEIEIIYTDQPFNVTEAKFSYEDNLEGFDGLTGIAGPEDDETPIRNWGVIRDTLYCVTGNELHETSDNGDTEPSGWGFRHVADNCGAWGISALSRNPQGIGSAGKEWMMWGGPDGAQIFVGQQPAKVSQEIESLWEQTNQELAYKAWTANDEVSKRCYFGVPVGDVMTMLVLDYRNLSGEAIGASPPVHISFTGKMIASDLTRKWTRWNVAANCGELLYRPNLIAPVMVFGGGKTGANAYTLNPAQFTDDDFGTIASYYTTYFFVSHEMEQALQVGSHRKLYQFGTAFIEGVGYYNVTPLGASLDNAFPATPNQALSQDQPFDLEFGLNVETSRCAFKIAVFPLLGQTDAYFSLQKLVVNMRVAPWAKVRGTNSGSF